MRWFAVLFLGLASFVYVPRANACSCMKLTPSEGLTSSSAVFTGEVVDIANARQWSKHVDEIILRIILFHHWRSMSTGTNRIDANPSRRKFDCRAARQ